MITPEQLKKWRAEHAATTPGPWRITLDFGDPGEIHGPDGEIDLFVFYDAPQITHDGEFIIHAHEYVPALLDEVDRLRARLKNDDYNAALKTAGEENQVALLRAQLKAEILRRDSLDETVNSLREEFCHKEEEAGCAKWDAARIRKPAAELIDAADPQIAEIAPEFRKYITALDKAIKEAE